jgi:membrane protein
MGMGRWKFILMRGVKGYGDDKCSSFAAGIAYYALLSIFPLAVFAVTLGGYILRNDPSAQERMINSLLNNLPLSSTEGRSSLYDALSAVTKGRAGLGLLGLLGAAYSASALFGAVRSALNVVFRVGRPRPFVQTKLFDLGMVFGLGLLMLLSLALTAVLAIARNFSSDWFGNLAVLVEILLYIANIVLPPLVSAAVFIVLYKIVPHAEINWRHAVPGALIAAFAFEALKLGFAQYVAHFGNYDAVYGTLGFVIAFLFFAYLSAQIVLFGAEVTRSYIEVATGAAPAAAPAIPKRPMSLTERVEAMVKGLFVAPDPHHDDSLPYAPARDGGPLSDQQAEQTRG